MIKRTSGTVWKTKTGNETVNSFMPYPLPPRKPPLKMTEKRKKLLSKAEERIKRINLSLPILPYPDWIIFSFMRKESVVSAQIEGTQSTLVDLFTFEATREKGKFGEDLDDILSYLKAFKFARKNINSPKGLPLSMRLLNDAHRILLQGSRGREKAPGQIRSTQNWIQGTRPGNAAYVPPPPDKLLDLMSQLETYIHSEDRITPLIRVSLVHAHFETIHPYLDGNGRLGRLLISILLEHWGILSEPVVYLSLFFKKNRDLYYRFLTGIRETGDWESWVDFFLEAVIETASQVMDLIAAMSSLINKDRSRCHAQPNTSALALRLFEKLPVVPFFKISLVQKAFSVSAPTAQRAINDLAEANILVEVTGHKKNRIWCYSDYVELLKEGTEPI